MFQDEEDLPEESSVLPWVSQSEQSWTALTTQVGIYYYWSALDSEITKEMHGLTIKLNVKTTCQGMKDHRLNGIPYIILDIKIANQHTYSKLDFVCLLSEDLHTSTPFASTNKLPLLLARCLLTSGLYY